MRPIDADALIKKFMNVCRTEFEIKNKCMTDENVIALIYNAPTVERPLHSEWIPVSERLPEGKINPKTNDFESVLCSTVWDDVRPYKFGKPIGHDKAHFWWGCGVMDDYVIAWMPLPEAYKEEAKND